MKAVPKTIVAETIGKMNPDVKTKWLEALRSGEYKQARGQLQHKHGFCCLGVLCDIYAKEGKGSWEKTFYQMDGLPPDVIKDWAGLAQHDPIVDFKVPGLASMGGVEATEPVFISALNDAMKLSFLEIADKIEASL